MKKLLAVLLTVVMLLSACAMAEGIQVTVGNIVVCENGQALADLTGFDAMLTFAAEDGLGGVNAHFDLGGTELCNVLLAMIGQQVLLEANVSGSQVAAYYLDLNTLMGVLGQNIDLNMIQESIGEALAGDDSPIAFPEELAAELLAGCISDGGVNQIGGVDYETTLVEISPEQMRTLLEAVLEMLVANGNTSLEEAEEALEALESGEIELSLSGAIYTGSDSGIINMTLYVDGEDVDDAVAVSFYLDGRESGDGLLFSVSLEAASGDESYSLDLDVSFEKLSDTSWLPLDVDGAVDILTVEDLESELTESFMGVGQTILMGAVYAMQMNAGE